MKKGKTEFWRDCLAVGGLWLMMLLFVGPALLPGRVMMPLDIVTESWTPWQPPNQPVDVNNQLLADIVNYIVPVKQLLAEQIRQGSLPLWNPYLLAGYPLTYNTQAGAFYPFTSLFYFLGVETAVDATIIGQMMLGLLFMYGYLRSLRLKRLAAMAGAQLFMFNGLMIVWLEWEVVHAGIIWLPLQLYLVERIARKVESSGANLFKSILPDVVWAGLTLGIPWLGGHWNWTLYTSMTLAAYALWRIWPLLKRHPARVRRQVVATLALLLALGVGLSLVQTLPAAVYLSQSHRQPFTLAESQERALLNRLVVLFVPNFFGNPIDLNWWGPRNFNETTLYLGILPLLLTGLTLFLRRDRSSYFFAGWGMLGFLWSLGAPFYWMLHILPIFNGLFPSRAAILVVVCGSVLAAMSLDKLLEPDILTKRRVGQMTWLLLILFGLISVAYFVTYRADVLRTWDYLRWELLAAVVFALAAGGLVQSRLRGWLAPSAFGVLVLVLVAVDLFWFGNGYNTITHVNGDLYPETAVAQFLHTNSEPYRIVTLSEGLVYPPNSSMIERIENFSGYEPGILRRTVQFANAAEGGNSIRAFRVLLPKEGLHSPLLKLLNIKYIVSTHDFWLENPTPGATQPEVDSWMALLPNEPVGQHFSVDEAGLYRIDVQLQSRGNPEGLATLRVFTADGVLELAHADLNAAEIQAGEWTNFHFGAFSSEWGREFYATVEFNGQGGDILLGVTEQDRYMQGTMTINGQPVIGDWAFTTFNLSRPGLVFEDGKARIYLNEGYFDRVFVVPQAMIVNTPDSALTAVTQQADNLRQIAILELENQPPPPELGQSRETPGQAVITDYALNHVIIEVDMQTAGFLILGDTYYPGWRATVDGQRTPVYRADYLLRGVYVPAGQHTIRFSFLPTDFVAGASVSGLTLLVAMGLLWWTWRAR